ncbi:MULTISPECIES: ParM/StbA family protein [Acidiplasma]|uniref:Archaeal actin-like protein n=1 Tax=Acidiplasma aeolicum TaxID=507754 RepID=A0A0P9H0R9_9ARCH|nr:MULTISPECIES: ParM/StbA family protein [Acidiplasma]KPV47619.1 Archaeal actin-like protein [Acidiplasma aeolicum]
MITIGLDLGYGDTKVISENEQRYIFPSRWAKAESRNWGIGGNIPIISVDDGDSFVFGKDAIGSGVRQPQEDSRLSDPNSYPLLAAALWVTNLGKENTEVTLASGTQLGSFEKEVEKARNLLEGKTIKIKSSAGEEQKFTISKLVMRPQGVGAAIYLLNRGLIRKQYGNAVIIDIGFRTTDVLTINMENMEPIVELSFTIQAGVGDVVSGISKVIAKETGFIVPADVARDAISSKVVYSQKEVGGPIVSQPLLDALAQKVIDDMRENMREDLDRITALIPVGGGSILVGQKLDELAPGHMVKVPVEDMQFTNVLGYRIAASQ